MEDYMNDFNFEKKDELLKHLNDFEAALPGEGLVVPSLPDTCKLYWKTIKPILDQIMPLLKFIPGVGGKIYMVVAFLKNIAETVCTPFKQ
jgi:hypothetical protein